jgi:signal peptidase I
LLSIKRKDKSQVSAKHSDGKADKKVELTGMAAFKVVLWEYGKAIIMAVILTLIVRTFFVQAFHIPSSSMVPTLLIGDRVLVNKFAYGFRNPFNNKVMFGAGEPERGDVVVFKFPADPKVDFVKRVIGLPGDRVQIIDGKIYINNELIEDPHGAFDSNFRISRNFGPTVVPEHQYFMMGDNRDYSNDSRSWGFVDSSLLRGKAWRLYFSWDSSQNISFFKRLRGNRMWQKVE